MESKTGIESRISSLIAQIQGKQTADFSSNFLDDEDAKAIAAAFKSKPSLQTLNFQFNEIGDEGAKAIAEALKTNSSLQKLDLGGNIINDEGAIYLAELLKSNHSLQTLNLGFNKISDDGAKAIFDAIEANISLIDIRLNSNDISKELLDKINERIERNRQIQRTAYLSPFCTTGRHLESSTHQFLLRNPLYDQKLIGLIDSFIIGSSPIAISERKSEKEASEIHDMIDDTAPDSDAEKRWAELESPLNSRPPILTQFAGATAESLNLNLRLEGYGISPQLETMASPALVSSLNLATSSALPQQPDKRRVEQQKRVKKGTGKQNG